MIRNIGIIIGRVLTFLVIGAGLALLFSILGRWMLVLIVAAVLFSWMGWSWDNEIE